MNTSQINLPRKNIPSSLYAGRPVAEVANETAMTFEIVDVRTSLMTDLPILKLFVNPSSIRQSMRKLLTRSQTLGGFVEEHWGNAYDNVSAAGTSLGFFVVNRFSEGDNLSLTPFAPEGNLRQEQNPRLRPDDGDTSLTSEEEEQKISQSDIKVLSYTDLRRQTEAYLNFIDLLEFYKTNAALHNDEGKVIEYGMVRLSYNNVHFEGQFTNFNYRETANKPALFEYDFTFDVFRQVWGIER